MTFYLASDESAGFPIKAAEVAPIIDPTHTGGLAPDLARMTVDDWHGERVDGIVCDRFGAPWADPEGGIPRYIRFWARGSGESWEAVLQRATAGEVSFWWFILCEDLATAERFRLAG